MQRDSANDYMLLGFFACYTAGHQPCTLAKVQLELWQSVHSCCSAVWQLKIMSRGIKAVLHLDAINGQGSLSNVGSQHNLASSRWRWFKDFGLHV